MRIQHNITAMSAYRNYTNNTNAVTKNLEKLSSGYKINRAGDDAAGLAISEKMRAQISGLETAQKNAKDGISLVKTAEGALQEVHDMLNRMVTLATQSANGTYDGTDREQLQKEVDQLRDEINRIADSSNFNGIKLLDGSMSTDANKITGDARIINDVYTSGKAAELSGTKTFLDGEVPTTEQATIFEVDFNGLTAKDGAAASGAKAVYSFDLSGVTADATNMDNKEIDGQTLTFDTSLDKTMGNFVTAYNGDDTKDYTASWDSTTKKVTLTAKEVGAVTTDPTTDLKGSQTTPATKEKGVYTITSAGDYVEDDTITINGQLYTVKDTPQAGQDHIATADVNDNEKLAAFVKDKMTADADYNITVAGNVITVEAKVAGAVAAGNAGDGTQAPQNSITAPTVTGNSGAGSSPSVTKEATSVTGAAATTTNNANITAVEVTEGEDADPAEVTFDFTIGDKKVSANFTPADAAAGGTADEIADAALAALGATVTIKGVNYTVEKGDDAGKLKFTLADPPTEKNIAANVDWDVTGTNGDSFDGNHTAGVTVTQKGQIHKDAPKANTVFRLEESDIKDGTKITIDGKTVTLAVGKNSKVNTNQADIVNLKYMEEGAVNLDQAISEISDAFGGTVAGENGTNWTVGVNDTSNGDTHKGLTVHKANDVGTYDTKAKLAAIFGIEKAAGNGLTLQIGDTADTYNQLKVSISDCHAASLGLSGIDISTQTGAAEAVDAIKAAINQVSDVRGTLGATQNRLEHTINNLSVMTENIQDAESTIRDTDIAEEMMAYTKNNILVQSAQAMLAQANQIPQGVLQLLG